MRANFDLNRHSLPTARSRYYVRDKLENESLAPRGDEHTGDPGSVSVRLKPKLRAGPRNRSVSAIKTHRRR
jgi:hypothetical protein